MAAARMTVAIFFITIVLVKHKNPTGGRRQRPGGTCNNACAMAAEKASFGKGNKPFWAFRLQNGAFAGRPSEISFPVSIFPYFTIVNPKVSFL
jgi:hypothetical protein